MQSAQPQRIPGQERRQELEALSGWIAAWHVSVEWLAAYFRKGGAFNWKIQSPGLSNTASERGSFSGQACNRSTADDSRCRSGLSCRLNNRCMRVHQSSPQTVWSSLSTSSCRVSVVGIVPIFMPSSTATLCASPRLPFLRPAST